MTGAEIVSIIDSAWHRWCRWVRNLTPKGPTR